MTRLANLLGLALLLFGAERATQAQEPSDQVKVLGEFTNRYKITNRYVLVQPGLTDDQLVTLAKKLHETDPKVAFWFLDSDEKAPQLLTSLKEIEAGNTENFPGEWVNEHVVANMQEWMRAGGRYWVLCKGSGMDKLAEMD